MVLLKLNIKIYKTKIVISIGIVTGIVTLQIDRIVIALNITLVIACHITEQTMTAFRITFIVLVMLVRTNR